jgi:hypothetical protein
MVRSFRAAPRTGTRGCAQFWTFDAGCAADCSASGCSIVFYAFYVYLFLISVIVFWSLAVRFGYRMRSWPCSWTLSWLRSCFVFARSSTFVVVGLELDNGSFPRRGLHFAFSMRREVV